MTQSLLRFAQAIIGPVEFGVTGICLLPFGSRGIVDTIGMDLRRQGKELQFQRLGINPRAARFVQEGKIVGHLKAAAPNQALKLSPQEQLVAALGFFTLNPPSCKAST